VVTDWWKMESSLLALHPPFSTTNAVRFTDFQWVTFHLDAKSASRTLATGTAISIAKILQHGQSVNRSQLLQDR
jgi:hypothetical protein